MKKYLIGFVIILGVALYIVLLIFLSIHRSDSTYGEKVSTNILEQHFDTEVDQIKDITTKYYQFLIDKEYGKAAELLSVDQFKFQNTTQVNFIENMRQADAQGNISRERFVIDKVEKLNEGRYLVSVTINFSSGDEKKTSENVFLVKHEQKKWLLDFSGFLSEESLAYQPARLENNQIHISSYKRQETVNNSFLTFTVTNLRNDKFLRIGVFQPAVYTIIDKGGEYTSSTQPLVIPPKRTLTITLKYEKNRVSPELISLESVYWTDIDGTFSEQLPMIPFVIPLRLESEDIVVK